MSFSVDTSTHAHAAGDSITAGQPGITDGGPWYLEDDGFKDQFYAAVGMPAATFQYGQVTGTAATLADGATQATVTASQQDNMTGYGVGGKTSSDLVLTESSLWAWIGAWNPALLLLEFGTNDFGNSISGASFAANMAAAFDWVHLHFPDCKILALSTPVRNETWVAGPHLGDGLDTWVGNTLLAAACAARSSYCEYVDLLTPALTYLVANNTTPTGGVSPFRLTYDSLHPTPLYKRMMGDAVMAHLTAT